MAKQMGLNVLFVGKKMRQPFSHLRAKIVIVDSSKWVKKHHFYAQLSHCFASQLWKFPPLATHTEVNNNKPQPKVNSWGIF